MKNTFLLLGLTAILFSCKKKEENNFEAKDMTGNTVVEGIATKQVGGNTTPAVGAVVTVKIKNSGTGGLYPGSSSVGSEVYTGTTNAMGKYSISVKTNGTGVTSEISFKGFAAANDTAMGSIVYDYPTSVYTPTLYKGVSITQNNTFVGSPLVTPANQGVGTATVTGILYYTRIVYTNALNTTSTSSVVPAANKTIYLEYDKDPMTLTKKIYTGTTDATGHYSFVVTTPNQTVPGFAFISKIYVNDLITTQDSVRFNGTVVPGKTGFYGNSNTSTGGVYSTIYKNNIMLSYGAFTADL